MSETEDQIDEAKSGEGCLFSLLPDDLFNHPDCFDSIGYWRWEKEIATPALEALGYRVSGWSTGDGDSFGPLVRTVQLTKDGVTKTYSYG